MTSRYTDTFLEIYQVGRDYEGHLLAIFRAPDTRRSRHRHRRRHPDHPPVTTV